MSVSMNRPVYSRVGMLIRDDGKYPQEGLISHKIKDLLLGVHGHYGYPDFPPNRDCGGAFRMISREQHLGWSGVGTIYRGGPANTSYEGSVAANLGMPDTIINGFREPDGYGAEAFDKMKPTKPDFNALNFLYEFKDIPQMLRARHQKLADIGSYYLALKFGWEPLLKDIVNLVNVQRGAQDRLKQLIRDNGRSVRRRVTLFDNVLNKQVITGSGYGAITPILDTWFYDYPPTFTDRHTHSDRCWASGRFKYHLPPGPRDVNWTGKMLRKIYGVNPSPAVLWNAIPYTWLIDWFSNAGHIIANMDAGVADRLAADYCYIMREHKIVSSREATAYFHTEDGRPVSVTSTSHGHVSYKTRVPGSPFGFNISENSLTGMQLSILGALGLSRLR